MIVLGPSLNPSRDTTGANITGDNPIVGYNNLVTVSNLTADYALASNPISNLANPSTALTWQSGASILQYVTLKLTGSNNIDYLAVAGHNFFTAGSAVNAQGWLGDYVIGSNLRALSIPILSEAGYPLLSEGGSQILAEGTIGQIGDMAAGGGLAAAFDNTTAQAAAAGAAKAAATSAYVGSNFSSLPFGKRIFKATIFGSNDAGYVSAINPSVTINLRGMQTLPGSAADAGSTVIGTITFTDTANESAGRDITSTDQATQWAYVWVEVLNGGAANQINVAELQLYESLENWFDLTTAVTPTDNLPMFFRFNVQTALQKIRLQMGAASAGNPQAAVMYVGQSLVFQRRVYVGHTPMTMGRVTNIVTGMSENANYLGRILLGESRKTSVSLKNLKPDWYRAYFDPFIDAVQTIPFFFAWRPLSYPSETGYAWLSGDAVPVNQLPNGMMSVQLSLAGVAS